MQEIEQLKSLWRCLWRCIIDDMSRDLCVYTCLYGDYEKLPNQPIARESSTQFYCFTDNLELTSETWQIIYQPPIFPLDPVRSQRLLKIHPPEIVNAFTHSIYVDSSYKLLMNPKVILEKFYPTSGLTLFSHEFRETVNDEFMAVLHEGLDDHLKIYEQYHHYMGIYPETLLESPFHTAMIIRRSLDKNVDKVLDVWGAHISRYSRRDQLSINAALKQSNFIPDVFKVDLYASEFTSYNLGRKPNRNLGVRDPKLSIMPSMIQEYLTLRIHNEYRTRLQQTSQQKSKNSESIKLFAKVKRFLLRFKFFWRVRSMLLNHFPRIANKLKEG